MNNTERASALEHQITVSLFGVLRGFSPLQRPLSESKRMSFKCFADYLKASRVQSMDKDGVLMFNTINFKPIEECDEEIKEWIKENCIDMDTVEGRADVDEYVKTRYSIKGDNQYIKAMMKNAESHTCLILDYDSGISIDHALEIMQGFELYLYTSYSHRKTHHKFRVLLPLTEPIPIEEFRRRKNGLLEIFDGVDPASFSVVQRFFLPSQPPGADYFEWYQPGDRLDWKLLQPDIKKVYIQPQNDTMSAVERENLMRGLRQYPIPHGKGLMDARMALAWAMHKFGFTESDWLQIVPDPKDVRHWRNASKNKQRIANSSKGIIIKAARGEYQ